MPLSQYLFLDRYMRLGGVIESRLRVELNLKSECETRDLYVSMPENKILEMATGIW